MSDYTVLPGMWNGCFLLPADIVDRHLKLASSDAIKVLLYVLRNGLSSVDADKLSSALNIDRSSALDAIDYWVADGLLIKSDGGKHAGMKSDISVPENGEKDEKSVAPAVIKSGRMPSYSHTQISSAVKEHPELKGMFASAEDIFARPLSDAVINLLYGLYDWFELPANVIIAVLKRCETQNKLRPAAIKDEAENFYRHGAVTVRAADEYVASLAQNERYVDEVAALLKITDHAPYAKEKKAFLTWKGTYGFDDEVIALALDAALRNTEQERYTPELLPYLQKVLTTWYKGGVRTADDARDAQNHRETDKNNGRKPSKNGTSAKKPSYDLEEEERLATQRFLRKKDNT